MFFLSNFYIIKLITLDVKLLTSENIIGTIVALKIIIIFTFLYEESF